ncbi:hypothetical protein X975_18657, partial [Stegodyphus mimosarum]
MYKLYSSQKEVDLFQDSFQDLYGHTEFHQVRILFLNLLNHCHQSGYQAQAHILDA